MTSHDLAFHDLSSEAIVGLQPSEVLLRHLENAQLAHRVCVAKAMKANEDVVEHCSLTWGEVMQRYRQWAEYRPPFQDTTAMTRWKKFWGKESAKPQQQE